MRRGFNSSRSHQNAIQHPDACQGCGRLIIAGNLFCQDCRPRSEAEPARDREPVTFD